HGVGAVLGTEHAKTAANDGVGLLPRRTSPLAPILELHAVWRHKNRKTADTDIMTHCSLAPSFMSARRDALAVDDLEQRAAIVGMHSIRLELRVWHQQARVALAIFALVETL